MPKLQVELTTKRALVAIQQYCDWLNTYNKETDSLSDFEYTPEVFSDSGDNCGSATVEGRWESDGYDVLLLRVYDGDDGGPAMLTCWFEQPYTEAELAYHAQRRAEGQPVGDVECDGTRLYSMVQQFDSSMGFIHNNGEMVNTGGY
jgi:hypothetical protein